MTDPEVHTHRVGRALDALAQLAQRSRAETAAGVASATPHRNASTRQEDPLLAWGERTRERRSETQERAESNREILDALHTGNYADTGRLVERIRNADRIDGASDIVNLT